MGTSDYFLGFRMKRQTTLAWMMLGILLLQGCAWIPSVGPDYAEQELSTPDSWLTKEVSLKSTAEDRIKPDWWGGLNDPALTALISRALASSPDLKVAKARVEEARALLRVATAGFFPQVNVGYEFQRSDPSDASFQGLSRSLAPFSQYSAGFDATWEIDLFGGLRREREGALAALEQAEATYADAMVTLLSDVARTYYSVRAAEKRLLVNRRNLETQAESLELVRARFEAGLVSELDVAQSTNLVETTRARLPQIEDTKFSFITALGVLIGEFPESVQELLVLAPAVTLRDNLGNLPTIVPVGIPADLLRRRPDVRALERAVAAQSARVGVATSDLFPRISLTGQFGYTNVESGSLFDKEGRRWSFTPAVQLPLFRGGSIWANIEAQDQRLAQALALYEKGVLSAVSETEQALSTYARQRERQIALLAAFRASERALELSRDLYTQGITDFQRVLDAEREALQSEENLVFAEEATMRALISIYKALGGGWEREATDFEGQLRGIETLVVASEVKSSADASSL
jgi:NodT family efflux transporter outer membrane factor (OMF) lipoprotein